MKFVLPIQGRSADGLYELNRTGFGGFYPIGINNTYHGGLHFDGRHAVVAIADGTIVAYRYTRHYNEETTRGRTFKYSKCFVLIRHEYTTPKGQEFVFYSHYIHLCPWEDLSTTQQKNPPAIVVEEGYEITATELNVRRGPSVEHPRVEGRVLVKGEQVIAAAVNGNWAKIRGAEEFFCFKGNRTYARPKQIIATPELDALTTCEIPVKAGTLIGYSGFCESPGAPEGYTTVHVEVFAGMDAEQFITNPKKEGQKNQFLIAEGVSLYHRDRKYPDPAAIERLTRAARTVVEIVDQTAGGAWIRVKDKRVVATVDHAWLAWNDTIKRYGIKEGHLQSIKTAFDAVIDGLAINANSKFEYISRLEEGGVPRRKIRFAVDESEAKQYWIERSWLDTKLELKADKHECYLERPDAPLFERLAGEVEYESVVHGKGAETDSDGERMWFKVNPCGIEGWVDATQVTNVSPYDWPGFQLVKEEEPAARLAALIPLDNTARDNNIDYNKLPPFFKKIFDAIDTDAKSKGVITRTEMKAALEIPAIANKLSRLICYHQSEWWADESMTYWQDLFDTLGSPTADALRNRIQELCWWAELTLQRVPTNTVYHWHPVAFVQQMRALNQEPPWLDIARREIGEMEIPGTDSNPRIVQYHRTTTLAQRDQHDEVSWCSSFVNWCMKQAGYTGTGTAWALDWRNWGKRLPKPGYGSIAVISWPQGGGHVGFVVGKTRSGSLQLLGGNQGPSGHGSVNVTPFSTANMVAYVMPVDWDNIDYDLEEYNTATQSGTYDTTR